MMPALARQRPFILKRRYKDLIQVLYRPVESTIKTRQITSSLWFNLSLSNYTLSSE